MKYIFNKTIFIINFIVCFIIVGGVILDVGISVLRTRTETLNCFGHELMECKFIHKGEEIYLKGGEEIILNKYPQNKLNIGNYGVWVVMIISLTINHIKFNKGFFEKLRKKYKN